MRLARFLLFLGPLILLISAGYVGSLALQENLSASGIAPRYPTGQGATSGAHLPALPIMEFKKISPDTAVEINEKIPFSTRPNPAANAFHFTGNEVDRQRALTCLTAAAYYEAGNDLVGASAVIQVVLNRLRHPAFPKTICNVVFQGSERATGCQFTFTCDGALNRQPEPKIWSRLRGVAQLALSGFVFSPVGVATHYHTNWVVPYWSGSLEKNAQVGTHLFFRWPGWYGSVRAFSSAYQGGEIVDARIARFVQTAEEKGQAPDPQLATIVPTLVDADATKASAVDLQGSRVRFATRASDTIMVQLEPQAFPGSYATMALALCKDKPVCQVWGWTDPRQVPQGQQISAAARQSASFHFQKSLGQPNGRAQWNCREFKRGRQDQCLATGGNILEVAPVAISEIAAK